MHRPFTNAPNAPYKTIQWSPSNTEWIGDVQKQTKIQMKLGKKIHSSWLTAVTTQTAVEDACLSHMTMSLLSEKQWYN